MLLILLLILLILLLLLLKCYQNITKIAEILSKYH